MDTCVLASPEPFAESVLWQLQTQYFAKRGVEAWSCGDVPFYITSNPTIANSYAQVVWAFRQDRQRLAPSEMPLTICELGGGSGAFAFFFIRRMIELCRQAGAEPAKVFRYVLTDAADANLAAWRRHPLFSDWLASGLLDIAHFDITRDHALTLQISGQSLDRLAEPLVVIANYLFDSIPQDLFYLKEGRSQRCLLSLSVDKDPSQFDEAQWMEEAKYEFHYEPLSGQPYDDPALSALFAHYLAALTDTHVLVPAPGWRGLQCLAALSQSGILLLAADKGSATLEALDRQSVPYIQNHGSVSLPVNIHALRWLAAHAGGDSLAASDADRKFTIFALLQLPDSTLYQATRAAFAQHVEETSPGDFCTVSRVLRKAADQMTIEDILAYVRLSRYDSHQFKFFLLRLVALAHTMTDEEKAAVAETVENVWVAHFPLGEEFDLAHHLGCLLYEMDYYAEALRYFCCSQNLYGAYTGTMFNIASCHWMMGSAEQAAPLLERLLQVDNENVEARELLRTLTCSEIYQPTLSTMSTSNGARL